MRNVSLEAKVVTTVAHSTCFLAACFDTVSKILTCGYCLFKVVTAFISAL